MGPSDPRLACSKGHALIASQVTFFLVRLLMIMILILSITNTFMIVTTMTVTIIITIAKGDVGNLAPLRVPN